MTDPKPPRPPVGRPRIDPVDPAVNVHVMVQAKTYDRIYRLARAEQITIPEVFRRALRQHLPPDR